MKKRKHPQKSQWDIFWEPLTSLDKKTKYINPSSKKTGHLLTLTALAPFVGWGIGAVVNSSGWMSQEPFTPISYVVLFSFYHWQITLLIIGIPLFTILLLRVNRALFNYLIAWFLFVVSLIFSLFVMTFVKNADSSEFTG